MSRALGIDLGTSNSVVAVLDPDGRPRIVTNPSGSTTTPSLVWYADEGVQVGEAATPGLQEQPETTIVGIKRFLGRGFAHPEVVARARALPFALAPAENGDVRITCERGQRRSPEEIAAEILAVLRAHAQQALAEQIDSVVITVPAWYDAAQRQATKDAAAIAGLTVRRLLSEPVAAVMGYGAHRGVDRRYVVCDFGGGTFDVAVVDVIDGVFEVLATAGDASLGGDDLDATIAQHFARELRATHGLDVSADALAVDRLRQVARQAKHALSDEATFDVRVPRLMQQPSGKSIDFAKQVRRDLIELWTAPLLQRLIGPCERALAQARCERADIDEILLVGGMTRMPAVQRTLARWFAREPVMVPNPEEIVAVGAAIEVARLEGLIEGILVIDVCPAGIAVSIEGGPCVPVIVPGAPVPMREAKVIATTRDGQASVEFDLWEGDNAEPGANRHLGRYVAGDLPPAPAGEVLVVVEVTLDVDGGLRVAVTELISGDRPTLQSTLTVGLGRAAVQTLRTARERR